MQTPEVDSGFRQVLWCKTCIHSHRPAHLILTMRVFTQSPHTRQPKRAVNPWLNLLTKPQKHHGKYFLQFTLIQLVIKSYIIPYTGIGYRLTVLNCLDLLILYFYCESIMCHWFIFSWHSKLPFSSRLLLVNGVLKMILISMLHAWSLRIIVPLLISLVDYTEVIPLNHLLGPPQCVVVD